MNKDLKQKIKSQCPFLHLSDIALILKQLKQDKPHLEILRDHRINTRALNSFQSFQGKKDQEIQCLQMVVFDKIVGIKKIIEIFLVEKLEQQLQLFITHIQHCKNLLRTDLVLRILDSYYLNKHNVDSDEIFFYIIEYEYFDYSNRDISGYLSQKESNVFLGFQKKPDNFEDQQHKQQIENHLFQIYQYCDLSLCPQKKKRLQVTASDIKNLSYVTFQQQADKSEIIKLNPVDGYLFERDFIVETEKESTPLKQKYPKLFYQPNFQIQIEKQNFVQQFKHQFPTLFEQYREVLQNLITVNEQYTDYLPVQYQEREKQLTFLATSLDQQTSFKIVKFNSIEEAQIAFNQTEQKIKQLCYIQIQPNIVKQEIIFNQQGQFIVKQIDLSILNQKKNLVEIRQNDIERSFSLTDSEVYQQYLQKLEIFTKLILWLIKNIRIIQQLQVQPGNLFVSESGQIYLNDSLDEFSSQSYDSNEILIQKYTQAIITIFDLDIFWLLFDHIPFARKLSQKAKINTLIRNYFSTVNFKEEMWNIAAYQELERIFNNLLKLKTINERYETISLQISSNSLDNYEFKWNQWIFIKDNIQILKENKNIYNIKNIRYFDKKCVPSQLFNIFKQQFYQIFQINNNLLKEVLIQQLGQLIEQCLMIRQDKYIDKVKELTLQKIDELYDLNTLQLKPVNVSSNNYLCSCFKPKNTLDIYEVFSTMAYYYILMVIQDEQNKQTDYIQDKCLFEELFGFQSKIIQDQHNLKKISYEFTDCELLTKALKSQIDFFNFKANQNILTLNMLIYEKQLPDICKQLSLNRNNINSLKVGICSYSFGENQSSSNEKVKKLLKKRIPYLVQLF